jgi:hypothetical protein
MTERLQPRQGSGDDVQASERATLGGDMNASETRTMVDNIIEAYRQCDDATVAFGRDWYPRAQRYSDAIARATDIERNIVSSVIAALSPRNPWAWNVQDAAAFCHAFINGEDMPSATTFGANRRNAWNILRGLSHWTSSALKVRSFVRNIDGDTDAVTCDVWAVRVATNYQENAVKNDAHYRLIESAYREAARIVGETPRDLQAIVWSRAVASASVKKPKRGTFDYILALLTA